MNTTKNTNTHSAMQHTSKDWQDYASHAESKKRAARNEMSAAFYAKDEAAYALAESAWFDWQFEMNRCYYNASVVDGVENGVDVSYFGEFNDGKNR